MESTIPNADGPGGVTTGTAPKDAYRDAAQQNTQASRQQLKEAAVAASEDFRAKAGPRIDAARANARELYDQTETRIRERPWMALGIAALVGMAIAKLLR